MVSSFDPDDSVSNFRGFESLLRRSSRIRNPKVIQFFLVKPDTLAASPDQDNYFSYKDAISRSNSNQWVVFMQTERNTLNLTHFSMSS